MLCVFIKISYGDSMEYCSRNIIKMFLREENVAKEIRGLLEYYLKVGHVIIIFLKLNSKI